MADAIFSPEPRGRIHFRFERSDGSYAAIGEVDFDFFRVEAQRKQLNADVVYLPGHAQPLGRPVQNGSAHMGLHRRRLQDAERNNQPKQQAAQDTGKAIRLRRAHQLKVKLYFCSQKSCQLIL